MQQNVIRHIRSIALIACILFLAGILRCWNLNQSFWWDEIWSTMPYATSSSLWQTVSSLGYYFNNHLLYSLLARFSIKLLGENEIAARLPSVIMGLAAVAALFVTGKKFLGIGSAILGALLLAVSAFHIDHTSEARGYSGLALFSLLSSYYFLNGLRTNSPAPWLLFVLFTILGVYTHPFMLAVCFAQFLCAVLFFAAGKSGARRIAVPFPVLRSVVLALLSAAIVTLALYAPVLADYVNNLGKVRIVTITRWPFIISLFSSWCPGIEHPLGSIVYGALFCGGIVVCGRKDPRMAVYTVVLSVVPLALYLLLNPMFVFERYFIFALPFILLTISAAVVAIGTCFAGGYRAGAVLLVLLLLFYLQWPALRTILTRDRQNYREAVRFVEQSGIDNNSDLVFSIGYAGEHFRYYANKTAIQRPETLKDFLTMAGGKKRIWCLITAWLPAIRPAYEDQALYGEKPGQCELYNYVKEHFHLEKQYHSKYPVDLYYAER